MKRIISAVLAAAVLTSLTVSCGMDDGNTDGERVELKVWGSQDDMQLLRTMCDEFAAANTDKEYTVSFGVVGGGEPTKVFL